MVWDDITSAIFDITSKISKLQAIDGIMEVGSNIFTREGLRKMSGKGSTIRPVAEI
jgi:hypothetical protein